jgi:hypothetical protein
MSANAISFGSDLMMKCQTFSQLNSKKWYCLAPMGQQEPVSHYFIIRHIHMEDIQWSEDN